MTCIIVANYSAAATTTEKTETGAVPETYSEVTANPYGITDSNDNATILQCWNWSYENLEKEIPKIAAQGFSVVQISPPNIIKEATVGHKVNGEKNNGWWMFYQPAGFKLNTLKDNALGTKTELLKMIKTAHENGIRVIADSVINHMGTCSGEDDITSTNPMDHVTPKAKEYAPEIYNGKLFHSPWFNMQYKENNVSREVSTYDLTRGCTSRLPDLKTEDSTVQTVIYNYLKEMVDCGIDGFRFDAVKHIETPKDISPYGSQFLPNTVSKVKTYAKNTYKKDLLSYGEILNTCGVGRSYDDYFPYMKVTDSNMYRQIWAAVDGGTPSSAIPQSMGIGSKKAKQNVVVWNESHDTYMNDPNGWDGTRNYSQQKLNKSWAATAARDGITSMYLARPKSLSQNLGIASETWWTSKEVAEVNKFNNVFSGQGEYLSSTSNLAVIGRGSKTQNGGAVLINCKGNSTSASNVAVSTVPDGTYKDRISGSTFTVKSGKVSGSIGSTGIAVIYNEPDPTVSATPSGKYFTDKLSIKLSAKNVDKATYEYNGSAPKEFTGDTNVTIGSAADTAGATYKVTLKGYVKDEVKVTETFTYTKANQESEYKITFKTNNVSGWTTVCLYAWNETSQKTNAKWPGVKMTGSGGTYTATIPNTYDRIIFNNNNNKRQTVDIPISGSATYTLKSTSTLTDGTYFYEVTEKAEGTQDPTYYPGAGENPTGTTATETVTETETETVTEKKGVYGDVDLDERVSIKDATKIQEHAASIETLTGLGFTLADVNEDGNVNVKDATCIQCFLANLEGTGRTNQPCFGIKE